MVQDNLDADHPGYNEPWSPNKVVSEDRDLPQHVHDALRATPEVALLAWKQEAADLTARLAAAERDRDRLLAAMQQARDIVDGQRLPMLSDGIAWQRILDLFDATLATPEGKAGDE